MSTLSKRTKYYLHTAIMLIIMICIGMLPPFSGITALGMQVLGIFAGAVYGWCVLGLLWPSILLMIALGLTDYCSPKDAFIAGFGNETVVTLILVFTFVAYLEESGLSQYIANWFISRKIGEGRPWIFTALIFASAYTLSAFTATTSTIVICWGIFYKICESIGVEKKSTYATYGICGIAIASCVTSVLFPFKAFSQVFYGLVVKSTEMQMSINFVSWFVYNFIISLAMMGLYLLIGRFILKPDMHAVSKAGEAYAALRDEKMTKSQKIAMVVLVIFVISQVLPSFLPEAWAFAAVLTDLGLIGCIGIALVVVAVLRDKKGVPVANVGRLLSNCGGWEIIIMMAATMPLSAALESEDVGILSSVIDWMLGTFSGLSATMFMVIVVTLLLLVTQFAHNMVLMIVFIPVLSKMGLNYDIHPFTILILVTLACQSAFLLPASSAPAAMVYGSDRWISKRHAYMYNTAFIIVAFIVLVGMGIPLSGIFFSL